MKIESAREILKSWEIGDSDHHKMLGIQNLADSEAADPISSSQLTLDQQKDLEISCELIFAIDRLVRLLYKHERDANLWLKRENLIFDQKSPLNYMLEEGLDGMRKIERLLHQRCF